MVLGQHTAVSIAKESGKWKDIPFLKDNEGMLPPSMMVVGDRRRVLYAAKFLKDALLLHEEVERLVGPSGSGRVNLAVGIYEHAGRPLPLTILETQMGCSAQDINAWEALVNSREDGYLLAGTHIPAKGIAVIRAGTCGGIIDADGSGKQNPPALEIGDVVVARGSFGDATVPRQRMGCPNSMDLGDMARFMRIWQDKGLGFTTDNRWPVIDSSPRLMAHLIEACRELDVVCYAGMNFTKESLYLESDEDWVRSLRLKYGALSTEMEHLGLAFLAHELTRAGINTHNGLISTVVGTVPGGSFAEPGSKEAEWAHSSENRMLEAVMQALWQMAYK